MNRVKSKGLDVSQDMLEVRNPVTPLPVRKSLPIILPSLSMKQREPRDESMSLTRRSVWQQRELTDHVSGVGEPFCPEPVTDPRQTVGLVYTNDKQLPSMEFLQCAIMQCVRIWGVVPGCLCVSSELQNNVRKDIDLFFGKSFSSTIPFLSNQEAVQYIPVHFLNDLSRDTVCGFPENRTDFSQ